MKFQLHTLTMMAAAVTGFSDPVLSSEKKNFLHESIRGKIDKIHKRRQLQTSSNAGPVPAQTFFVPFPESSLLHDTFKKINDMAKGPVHSLVSMTISTTGTVVWYDHWEDGYEDDVANPISSTTTIWGDGNSSNGCAPYVVDCTDDNDILTAGDSIVMDNKVDASQNRDLSDVKYDGGDLIQVSFPVAVTRGAFPDYPGSYIAGAVEVLPVAFWGTEYMIPAGHDTQSETNAFNVTAVYLQASEDDTNIVLPTGDVLTLNRGESAYLDVPNKAAVVTSDEPIQVDLVSGDYQSLFELRWFSIRPTSDWSKEYLSPMGDTLGQTKVMLFNPHDTPISVTYKYLNNGMVGDVVTETVDVPAKDNAFTSAIPDGSAVRLVADKKYIALSISDTVAFGNIYDWGFPVVPIELLTPIVLVGFGYGCTELDCGAQGNSRNVVFVSPVNEADIFVDFDNDGTIDQTINNVVELQGVIVKQETDDDMSGAVIWATEPGSGSEGTPVNMAAAYGQDPDETFDSDRWALDLGTVVLPFGGISARKTAELAVDNDGNSVISPGDVIEYKIQVSNVGQVDLPRGSITIQDTLDPHVTYVEGTMEYHHQGGTEIVMDDETGTPFPLDGDGITSKHSMPRRGGTHEITFRVLIDTDDMQDVALIVNTGKATASGMTYDFSVKSPIPPEVRQNEFGDDDDEFEFECIEEF